MRVPRALSGLECLESLASGVSNFPFCCCHKHCDQKQVRRGKDLFGWQVTIHHWGRPRQEFQARTWKQEQRSRDHGGNATYWSAPSDFLSSLSNTAQAHLPRDDNTHSWLDPPMAIRNEEMLHRHGHMPFWSGGFFSYDFLFPDDSRFVSSREMTLTTASKKVKSVENRCIEGDSCAEYRQWGSVQTAIQGHWKQFYGN